MRLARALIFVRTMGGPRTDAQEDSELCDNGYAVPVEGLEVRVDLQVSSDVGEGVDWSGCMVGVDLQMKCDNTGMDRGMGDG